MTTEATKMKTREFVQPSEYSRPNLPAEVWLMPRRPDRIERDIPLSLVPHVIMKGAKALDDDLERALVKKTHSYFYNVTIRTRSLKREYRKVKALPVPVRPEVSAENGCGA